MLLRLQAVFCFIFLTVAGFATANADAQTTFTLGTPFNASGWEPVNGLARFTIQGNATAANVMDSNGAMSWQLHDGLLGSLQLTALDFRGGDVLPIDFPVKDNDIDPQRSKVENGHHHSFLDRRDRFALALPCLKGWQAEGETFRFGTDRWRRERDHDTKAHGDHGDPSVTPEPATMLLFGSGLAALGALRRKHRFAA